MKKRLLELNKDLIQLEAISFDGRSYISLPIQQVAGTDIAIDMQYNDINRDGWSGWNINSTHDIYWGCRDRVYDLTLERSSITANSRKTLTLTITPELKVNLNIAGEQLLNHQYTIVNKYSNFRLGACWDEVQNRIYNYCNFKVYSLISKSNNIELHPCIYKDVVGMYDVNNDIFYKNKTSGVLTPIYR